MAKDDHRTLTNQPDPPDFSASKPKRIRTQIHRRTKSSGPLRDQWSPASENPSEGTLRTPSDRRDKMMRRRPRDPL